MALTSEFRDFGLDRREVDPAYYKAVIFLVHSLGSGCLLKNINRILVDPYSDQAQEELEGAQELFTLLTNLSDEYFSI